MLALENLSLAHGARVVIAGLNLAFSSGEVTALVGPNGAGKSTLLRAVFGDHRAESGQLLLDDVGFRPKCRRAWQSRIGYMPQENRARGGLTALEAVLLGSVEHLPLRLSDATLHEATAGLDSVGLAGLAQRTLEALSGGERQLVFFAQALMRRPRVLLLDEPVSALDLRHQILLLEQVHRVTREQNLITAIVLHDLNLATRFADRIVVLHGGGAVADGTPREVLSTRLLAQVYGVQARVDYDVDGRTWIQVTGAADGKAWKLSEA